MKLPTVLRSLSWPSTLSTPPKFLSDIPRAFKIAREHGWYGDGNERQMSQPRIRLNFMQPRLSMIADHMYTSLFWRAHQIHTRLRTEKTTWAQKIDIIFGSAKHEDPYSIKVWRLHSHLHFTAQRWLSSALRYSGRDKMVRVNLLEKPEGALPFSRQYLASARFAAEILLQQVRSS